jgi:excisionase family DNA binding protein
MATVTQDRIEPALLSIEEAARLLNIGRTRAYEMAAAGTMPGVLHIGKSVRVSRKRLESWIDEQAGIPAHAA